MKAPVHFKHSDQTRNNTPVVVVVDDSQNVDPDVSSVTITRKRKMSSTSTIDDLYATYPKKEIEIKKAELERNCDIVRLQEIISYIL